MPSEFSGPDSIWQGHAVWHLLTALNSVFLYLYLRSEEKMRNGLETAQAKLDGMQQGTEQGQRTERVRAVRMLWDLVGDLAPSDNDLLGLSLEELARTETELQRRLR